ERHVAVNRVAPDPAALRAAAAVRLAELAALADHLEALVGAARVVAVARLFDARIAGIGEAVVAVERVSRDGARLRPLARADLGELAALAEELLRVVGAASVVLVERHQAPVPLVGEVVVALRSGSGARAALGTAARDRGERAVLTEERALRVRAHVLPVVRALAAGLRPEMTACEDDDPRSNQQTYAGVAPRACHEQDLLDDQGNLAIRGMRMVRQTKRTVSVPRSALCRRGNRL